MNISRNRIWLLPFAMVVFSIAVPAAISFWLPQVDWLQHSLVYWLACWIYLAAAVLATRVTGWSLRDSGLLHGQEGPVTKVAWRAHLRTAEVLVLGSGLLSLTLGRMPDGPDDAVLFVSMRLGMTLLFLGGVVLLLTHTKMAQMTETRL